MRILQAQFGSLATSTLPARESPDSLGCDHEGMMIRRLQPDDATRVIPNLDHPPVEQLGRLFDGRLIIGALEDVRRLPHMIVFIEDVKSIVRHRAPPGVAGLRQSFCT